MLPNTLVQILIGLSIIVVQGHGSTRIVGGNYTTIDKFPYMVSIFSDGYLCGGSLIRPNVVLSAAHCFNPNKNQTNMYVFAGSTEYFLGKNSTIETIVRAGHSTLMSNDIALLKLTTPLEGRSIATIALPTKKEPYNVFMTAAGWGWTEVAGHNNSDILKSVNLKSMSREQCVKEYRAIPAKGAFCALTNGQDTCRGDSGGPLVHRGVIYGITSTGQGCAHKDSPGEYTSVFYYINWIRNVLEQFEKQK